MNLQCDYVHSSNAPTTPSKGRGVMVIDERGRLWTPNGSGGHSLQVASAPATLTDIAAAAQMLLSAANGPSLPLPTPVERLRHTGATYYIDPVSGNNGNNGTSPATPWQNVSPLTWAAGIRVLFKEGTNSLCPAGPLQPIGGTQANPIVIGVYEAVTGREVRGRVGAASLAANGGVCSVLINNGNYTRVEGLELTGGTNLSFGQVQIGGTAANNQVLYCRANDSIGVGCLVATTGMGNVIEGCEFLRNVNGNIFVPLYANNSNTRVTYNRSTVYVWDRYQSSSTSFTYDGIIAGNSITGSATPNSIGISVEANGGSFKIYRNAVRRCQTCITAGGSSPSPAYMNDVVIENNDVSDSGWFGIAMGNCYGNWKIQYNRVLRSGSYDRGANPSQLAMPYGRGIELYGNDAATGAQDGIVRFNYIQDTYCYVNSFGVNDGSEGVGIGLDNNSLNVRVHSNIIVNSEGNGIQANSNVGGCQVYGNLLINSVCAPPERNIHWQQNGQSDICIVLSPGTVVENNTCVAYGSEYQKIGIAESHQYPSPGARFRNNLLIGHLQAGVVRSLSGATESHNIVESNTAMAVTDSLLNAIAAGTGTQRVARGASGASEPYYTPSPMGVCDGSGASIDPASVSLRGTPLGMRTPIGALHPAM